jgi:hypothetical protein
MTNERLQGFCMGVIVLVAIQRAMPWVDRLLAKRYSSRPEVTATSNTPPTPVVADQPDKNVTIHIRSEPRQVEVKNNQFRNLEHQNTWTAEGVATGTKPTNGTYDSGVYPHVSLAGCSNVPKGLKVEEVRGLGYRWIANGHTGLTLYSSPCAAVEGWKDMDAFGRKLQGLPPVNY